MWICVWKMSCKLTYKLWRTCHAIFLQRLILIGIIFSEELASIFCWVWNAFIFWERGGQGASKKQRYFFGGQFLAAFLSNQTFQGFGLHSHSLGAREKIVPLKKTQGFKYYHYQTIFLFGWYMLLRRDFNSHFLEIIKWTPWWYPLWAPWWCLIKLMPWWYQWRRRDGA